MKSLPELHVSAEDVEDVNKLVKGAVWGFETVNVAETKPPSNINIKTVTTKKILLLLILCSLIIVNLSKGFSLGIIHNCFEVGLCWLASEVKEHLSQSYLNSANWNQLHNIHSAPLRQGHLR